MNLVALLIVVVAIILALKVAGFLFKLLFVLIVLGGLYWLLAPHLGMPMPG